MSPSQPKLQRTFLEVTKGGAARVRKAPSTDGHTRHRIITATFIIFLIYIPFEEIWIKTAVL